MNDLSRVAQFANRIAALYSDPAIQPYLTQPTTRRSHMATTLTWAKARPMLHTLRQLTRSTNAAEGVSITFHGGYVGTVADGVMTLALDGAPIYTAPADWPISGHGTRKKEAAS